MDEIKQMAKTVAQCIKGDTKKTHGYDTAATVKRIDGGTAYVSIPAGVPETPVKKTIDAKVGDTVQVHVENGTAWLVGNQTAPPTDDAEALVAKAVAKVADQNAAKAKTTADEAQQTANAVSGIANTALTQAQEAKQIADDTEQHFWFTDTGTDTGAHITEVTQEEWSDPSDPNYQSGGNLLARSNGIAVREGMKELATMSQDGFEAKTYDSSDNEVVIAHLGYGEGTDSGGSLSKAPYYDIGHRLSGSTKGNYSVAEGANTTASGYGSHAEGLLTEATGSRAHAEGDNVTASGLDSHAEGTTTLASGRQAHAEGDCTEATGDWGAHAEGYHTKAAGDYSHSQNYRTEAGYDYQTVIGKYNDNKSADLFEVGNGSGPSSRSNASEPSSRSNAFEVSQTGDITAPGKATLGAINGDSLFAYTSVSVTTSSISANASGEATSSASTLSGYYPLAITDVNISTGVASLRRFYFSTQQSGRAVVKIGVQNDGTSAKTISATAKILWVKTSV